MKSFSCPKCGSSIISNNSLNRTCTYCGNKVTDPYVEGYNRTVEVKKRQQEDFQNFKKNVSKSHNEINSASSAYNTPNSATKNAKQKKEHGLLYYILIGMVSYFLASALSLGFIGFIIIAVVLLAIF